MLDQRMSFDKWQWLEQSPLCAKLTDEQRVILGATLHAKTFGVGELIFYQRDQADCMYIIAQGYVQIFLMTTNAKEVREHNVRRFGPNEFFGERAVMTGGTRNACAKALSQTTTLTLSRDDFQLLLAKHPAIVATMLLSELAARSDQHNFQIDIMQTPSAYKRVMKFLLYRARPHTDVYTGSATIDLDMTHSQIGEMLGLRRETVNRVISHLCLPTREEPPLLSKRRMHGGWRITIPDLTRLATTLEYPNQIFYTLKQTAVGVTIGRDTHER